MQRPCGETELSMVDDSYAREDRTDREGRRAEGVLGGLFLLPRMERDRIQCCFLERSVHM